MSSSDERILSETEVVSSGVSRVGKMIAGFPTTRMYSSSPITKFAVDDILEEIFHHVHLHSNIETPHLSYYTTTGAILSSVCSRWRSIVVRKPSFWTRVFIAPISRPAKVHQAFCYSGSSTLHVYFSAADDVPFWGRFDPDVIQLVTAERARLQSLVINSPYNLLQELVHALTSDLAPMPMLESLVIKRRLISPDGICGPFTLNTPNLRRLHLDGVIMCPRRNLSLSRLETVSLARTDMSILDMLRLLSYPSTSEALPLVMPAVQHLSITETTLNFMLHRLSFNPFTLISIKLVSLQVPAEDLEKRQCLEKLLLMLVTEKLQSLELIHLNGVALQIVLNSLKLCNVCGLVVLRVTRSFDLTEALKLAFTNSFPQSTFPTIV
ncbi:hypothetical protein H0H93_007947 [Arthromyces matolae]|nr:hypothetical protein H0H93_007947 [Arthromyces matolae]